MHAPSGILFDLDDTLVAFDAVSEPAWQEVAREHAPRIGMSSDQLRAAIQAHNQWYWADPHRHRVGRQDLSQTRRRLVYEALRGIGYDDESSAHAVADHYTRHRTELMFLLPGVEALLTNLRGRGTRLGMVTNGTAVEQRQKIARFGLAHYFDFIQVEGELGIGKPEDAAYHHALARLGLPPEEVWFIGDNLEWDVRAPQRHGMTGVWVDRLGKGPTDQPHPHHCVRDAFELARLLGVDC